MFDNPTNAYQFLYSVMESIRNAMYTYGNYSLAPMASIQPQLATIGYDQTVCRICGDSTSNIHSHLQKRHRGRPRPRPRPRPQVTNEPIVNCAYCKNQMPPKSMEGHLLRIHNVAVKESARPAVKRKRSELETSSDGIQVIDQPIIKRQRYDAAQTINEALNDAIISRPQTPPIETQTDTEATEETTAMPIVQFDNKTYNLVHVSDSELNKFMVNGRIRIHNGYLYMNDTEQEE